MPIAAAAWSWVEKMFARAPVHARPSCIKVLISTAIRIVTWKHPITDDPARRGSGEKKP
jgi:hypothetical protein